MYDDAPSPLPRSLLTTNANLLVALELLLRERSVTRAAKLAGVSQSAMSGSLAQLREIFGDPLLVRVGRGMQPTPLASNVHGELARGVEALSAALSGGSRFDPTTSREHFVLALSDRVEFVLLGKLMSHVRSLAPRITLQVLHWSGLGPPPGLASGDADVGTSIRLPPGAKGAAFPTAAATGEPRAPGHQSVALFDSGLSSVVRREHPRVGKRLSLAAFCDLEHVLVTEQLQGRGIVDDALAALGRSRRIAARVPRHTLVADLVTQTDLIATIDRRVASALAASHGLRVFPPPFQLPHGQFELIWHDRTHRDPARRWLRQQIQLVAAQLDAGA